MLHPLHAKLFIRKNMSLIEFIQAHVDDINNYVQPEIHWREGSFAPHVEKIETLDCDFAAVVRVLPQTLTREQVAECFREDIYKGFVATILWGGINRFHSEGIALRNDRATTTPKLERLRNYLRNERHNEETEQSENIKVAYASMARGKENYFYGIGPSYFTKLLYFLAYDMGLTIKPLIYDRYLKYAHCVLAYEAEDRMSEQPIIPMGNCYHINDEDNDLMPTIPFAWASEETYLDYCRILSNTAREYCICRADKLEAWLFGWPMSIGHQDNNPRHIAFHEALKRSRENHMATTFQFDLNEDVETVLALVKAFTDNGINSWRQLYHRKECNTELIGCSEDKPLVINDTEDYVHLEYCLADELVFTRTMAKKCIKQELFDQDQRKIDCLTYKVWPEGQDEPNDTSASVEKYYFDITAGYKALLSHKK